MCVFFSCFSVMIINFPDWNFHQWHLRRHYESLPLWREALIFILHRHCRLGGLWLRPLQRHPSRKSCRNTSGAPPPDPPLCLHFHCLFFNWPPPRPSPPPPSNSWIPIPSSRPSEPSRTSPISVTSLQATHPLPLPPPPTPPPSQ